MKRKRKLNVSGNILFFQYWVDFKWFQIRNSMPRPINIFSKIESVYPYIFMFEATIRDIVTKMFLIFYALNILILLSPTFWLKFEAKKTLKLYKISRLIYLAKTTSSTGLVILQTTIFWLVLLTQSQIGRWEKGWWRPA